MVWFGEAALYIIMSVATIDRILCAQGFREIMSLNPPKKPGEVGTKLSPIYR